MRLNVVEYTLTYRIYTEMSTVSSDNAALREVYTERKTLQTFLIYMKSEGRKSSIEAIISSGFITQTIDSYYTRLPNDTS